jgi:cytosine/adenosine deaminase-related metal-dependent hydrolase
MVLPITRPAVEDGAVLISENVIQNVGRWRDLAPYFSGEPVDLGNVILMPGLVNGHCHLDYTSMTGLPPQKQFPDWIKGLLALKAAASYTDYAHSWLRGAGMLARTGTTTVADIEAVPELLPEVWSATPLRVFSFLELTSVRSRRDPAGILRDASVKIESLRSQKNFAGISPHALYSTTPDLLQQAAQLARQKDWRVTMHVAESAEETEMFAARRGPLFDWLAAQRDMSDCGLGTPLEQVERCGMLGENFLGIHANYLDPRDIAPIARSGASIVHCPRSHDYFRHKRFPFEELSAAGVNVCLGTDSLVSTRASSRQPAELNMFSEMRQFAKTEPGASPETIIKMATVNGAKALGLSGRIGEISEGAFADLIAIPFDGASGGLCDAILSHPGDVLFSMIDGKENRVA